MKGKKGLSPNTQCRSFTVTKSMSNIEEIRNMRTNKGLISIETVEEKIIPSATKIPISPSKSQFIII